MRTIWRHGGAIAVALTLSLGGCGGALDQKTEGSSGRGEVSVRLGWPEGYSFDPATRSLQGAFDLSGRSAPTYVTRIALKVTGDDMTPITIDVPLDTLTATVTVTVGERTFAIVVNTVNGDTFTGVKSLVVNAFTAPTLTIPLEINAPPVIERIDITPTHPKQGDLVTASAIVTDPDADDILTYRWEGGTGTPLFGQTVSERYEGCGVTNGTLTVTDGKGGSATKSFRFGVINQAPIATAVNVTNLTGSATNPKYYDDLKASCDVYDPDGGRLDISFRLADGTIDGGPTSQMNYKIRGGGDISCWAIDNCGAKSNVVSKSLNGGGQMRPGPIGNFNTNYAAAPFKLSVGVPANKDIDLRLVNEATNVSVWYGNFKGSNGTDLNNDYGCDNTAANEQIFVPASAFSTTNTYRVEVSSPNSSNCPAGGSLPATLSITYSVANQYLWVGDTDWSGNCTTGSCTVPVNIAAGGKVSSRFTIGP